MRITINKVGLMGGQSEATIVHRGNELRWNIEFIDKANIQDGVDIFEQLNNYWSYIPVEKQDTIFEVFTRIRRIFDTVFESLEMAQALMPLVAELTGVIDTKDIRFWIDYKSDIMVPINIKTNMSELKETMAAREKTYLREDYLELITLSIALRPMVLIWGEYMFRTKKEAGTTWKEYYAFQLLSQSYLFNCPAMLQLQSYIQNTLPIGQKLDSGIIAGISSEDFPTWILALVIVRRLAVGDIRGIDPNTSIIAFIHRYVTQKVKGSDGNFIGSVNYKLEPDKGVDSESNLSKLENYKIKQEIPAGEIAIIENYVSDTKRLAQKLCPSIDLSLLRESLNSITQLATVMIQPVQITLMQWVTKMAIPPRSFMYLDKQPMLNAMAVAQAVLWHKGHYEIAGLMTAIAEQEVDAFQFTSITSQARIPKEINDELDVLYPNYKNIGGKKQNQKEKNVAIISIDNISKKLREHEWRLTIPTGWLPQILGTDTLDRHFVVPYEIKIKLANLVVQIAKRQFQQGAVTA